MEELLSKYKGPYSALCEELKQRQAELKTAYMEALRGMAEILSEAVYADPDEEYRAMHGRFLALDEAAGGDPLLRAVMAGIASFEDSGDAQPTGEDRK